MAAYRDSASLPIDKKILLLNNLLSSEHSLLLYGQGVDVWRTFFSFIENGLAKDELCIFSYDATSSKVQLDMTFGDAISSGKLRLFPLGKGYLPKEIEQLEDEIKKLYEKARTGKFSLRIIADFGVLVSHHSFGDALDFVRSIISKRYEGFYSRQDKRKQPILSGAITAFNVESLDEDEIKVLVGLQRNVMISSQDGTSTLALTFRARHNHLEPGIELASKGALEQFVKSHLETIVLSMLREHPMCGYDVIKTIYQRYYTSLSQGTVYSLLYSLADKGILSVMKSESQRAKVYTLTEKGQKLAESQIEDFIAAQRYLLQSIQKPG